MGQTVAIIGGGFSGLLSALHLLRAAPELTVRLIERAPRFGRGRAYSTRDPGHLLNVRAANMSAFPDRPDHFVDWLGAGERARDWFVGRRQYGDYLQDLLKDAVSAPGRPGRLLLEQDEAVQVRRDGERFRIELALGRAIHAEAVVLAVGLLPPSPLPGITPEARESPNYVADPWRADLDELPAGQVLLLGSGLTMVDVALTVGVANRRLTAVSRRGLLPRLHAGSVAAPPPEGLSGTPARVLQILRRHADEVGWRAAVDGVRPFVTGLWAGWSVEEKARILRHLRPWWDAHRHRMAPAVAARIGALQADGLLEVRAGKLEQLRPLGAGFEAVIRRRGAQFPERARFTAVVDCSGLSGDLSGDRSGVLEGLQAQGLIARDPLGLGVAMDAELRLLSREGRVTRGLYAVGPLSRAVAWEAVAVPDIRNQTAQLAETIARDLAPASA
ncbi:FAD/NAD(P)-binding protein [Phenylobacterium sp. LjRoot219]|uniref:FAD/NAD(P)-binding protein n=1 Tax=Phenylobacterium sp. LjRoot219 TaxID=3342283 RepID=UPI003ECEBEC2